MKKKYLHEYRLVELFGMDTSMEAWKEDPGTYDDKWADDQVKRFQQELQDDMNVDPEAPTISEIQKVLEELEPDGWSEQLIKRHIIKRPTITTEELLSDLYCVADLHAFAEKTEAMVKIGVTFIEKFITSPLLMSVISAAIFGFVGVTTTGVTLIIAAAWTLSIIAWALGLAPAIADAADELFPSAGSKEDKLQDLLKPSPITRYLPFSPELEGLLSEGNTMNLIKILKERPGQQWTVEHFSNWAVQKICQDNPEANFGACGEAMTPEGRKPAYRHWVDWSAMHAELYSLKIPIIHKDVLKTSSKRWFGNVKDMILLGYDKYQDRKEQK